MGNEFRGVLFDLYGVLEFQGSVYPGAIETVSLLRRRGIAVRILSNSTLKSRRDCTLKLREKGFDVSEEEVITASYATARYLSTLNPRSCWVMVKGTGIEEFSEFHQDPENPQYIVLGDYREDFNFHTMNKALKCLLEGSQLIVMIPERVDRSMGQVELTVGAYGRMLEDASGVKATYVGKPNQGIYDMALMTMNLDRNEVLMVGDRLDTDILGARLAGIKSVLVKTGEFRESDLHGEIQPDYVIDSIADLASLFSRSEDLS